MQGLIFLITLLASQAAAKCVKEGVKCTKKQWQDIVTHCECNSGTLMICGQVPLTNNYHWSHFVVCKKPKKGLACLNDHCALCDDPKICPKNNKLKRSLDRQAIDEFLARVAAGDPEAIAQQQSGEWMGVAAALPAASERQASIRSRPVGLTNRAVSTLSGSWSGIVQNGQGFNYITGTSTVPTVSGTKHSGAAFWVGLDGTGSWESLMQAGVATDSDGTTFAWYEWFPQLSHKYDDLAVKPGDVIRLTVDASSTTGGSTTTENLTTGKSAYHTFTDGPGPLCQKSAEWVVESYRSLANYGNVTFSNAVAKSSAGIVSGKGDESYELQQGGKIVSKCSGSNGDVVCQYQS
ncbi:hypothetical protein VHEMI01416 [[Torrubiella] hemipterigena]|uniref:Aspergillopepsin-2 n=1 Tax=[Torrubiella] hemipterigena TaxID=1531966 RepID=A0A0A1SLV5_9HYPO|nr:hypothetical protein VHEMI01416 [[Torrubiella] hemipterigena]